MSSPGNRSQHSISLTIILAALAIWLAWPNLSASQASLPVRAERMNEAYGRLPLHFEANRGQTDGRVSFLARGSGYVFFLTANEAVLTLRHDARKPQSDELKRRSSKLIAQNPSFSTLRMKFVGANVSSHIEGVNELPGKVNYFIGSDSERWRTNIPTYAQVKYSAVYPGVDMICYGNGQQLESDFIVAPGADPGAIHLAFEGARRLKIDRQGNLDLNLAGGIVRLHKPLIYQESEGRRQEVPGGYVFTEKNQIGFQVGAYDATRPLVIDPIYSTYLGGSSDEISRAIAVDGTFNAYVTGRTSSLNFPTTPGALRTTYAGGDFDVFVTKLSADGSTLVYSTFLGGGGADDGHGIAVDNSGNAYLTGMTTSSNFPTVNPLPTGGTLRGFSDAFVAKLNSAGSMLVYSTYLGGSLTENDPESGIGAIAVDKVTGNAYVTGFTIGSDFPTTPSAFQLTPGGSFDAFVAKLSAAGSSLDYSTFFGGMFFDDGHGIAVDGSGNVYITGFTLSSNLPTSPGVFRPAKIGSFDSSDGYVAKFNPALSGAASRVYASYLGGSGGDGGEGLAVDAAGNAYVTGFTTSSDFPTVGAVQSMRQGIRDAFVTKVNANATALLYSTYLGGGQLENGRGIAVDGAGSAYVTGYTNSPNFPTLNAAQGTIGGGGIVTGDVFVTKLNAAGSAFVYSTFLGGTGNENGRFINPGLDVVLDESGAITADVMGNAYITGWTASTNFPTTPGAFQLSNAGGDSDAFIAKIAEPANLILTKSDSPDPVVSGAALTYTITVTNNGPGVATSVKVDDTLPSSVTFVSCATSGPVSGVCGGVGAMRTITFPTLPAGATVVITLVVNANCSLANGATISNTATVTAATDDPNPANNSATTTTTATNPPPVITCPANITAVAPAPGNTTVPVSYPAPTVTDNCPGAMVACSPPSGSNFPLGVTTVNCTATDSGGATASCSFTVTVWDVCIQDDRTGDFLVFNSFTGDYQFTRCGPGGFIMTGRGTISRVGCLTKLEDDTRVVSAVVDRCLIAPANRGSAKIKRTPLGATFFLDDGNILNNNCMCP